MPDTRELEYYSVTYPVDLMANGTGDAWARLQYCGGASCDTGHFRLYHIHNGEWTQVFDTKEYPMLPQQMALAASPV